MKRKLSKNQELYGSFLPCPTDRRLLFVFGHTDCWWAPFLSGFTHVVMAEVLDDDFILVIEPTLVGARILFRTMPTIYEWSNYTVLELVISPTRKNRLIRPIIQTCATVVQYLSGISMGAITAQGLYRSLTCTDRKGLRSKGIKEIISWVSKPH